MKAFPVAVGLVTTATILAATAAPASASVGKLSTQDVKFLQTSAAGDLFEIQAGKVALTKAQLPTTRAYAAKLVSDHSKSLADVRTIAKADGISLPTQPLPTMREVLAQVSAHSGLSFDVAYLKAEVTDHFGDIAGGVKEVERGVNGRIRANAANDLPVLRYHLWRGQLDLNYVLWHVAHMG
jgi:putative membrane protein